jgi:photosystem II stability/assembly factor-like uncharacterized protein
MYRFHLLIACLLLALPGFSQKKKTPVVPPVPQLSPVQPNLNEALAAAPWRNIGPFRGGRSVTACGVPSNVMTYYMGTTGGGLWKTEDAGLSWYNISDGYFKTGSVGAVSVAPSDPNVVYVGMGEHAPRGVMTSFGDGVYKSTDAGRTWNKTGLDLTRQIADIAIHPTNPEVVYVAAQGALNGPSRERGVYKSTDGGKTWALALFVNENTGCADLSMDPTNPRILYAAMWDHQRYPWQVRSGGPGSGLYKSVDEGVTWEKIQNGLPEALGKIGVSVCASNPQRLYAILEGDSEKEQGGLFTTTDGGKNWSRVSKDHRLTMRAWYYTEVFADPTDEFTLYVLNAPMLKSIDGGKTWTRISGTHGDYHDLWINPANASNMVVANDGGAAVTFTGGRTWSPQSQMPTAQMYRINVDNLFPYHIYGGQQDNTSVRIASTNPNGYAITEREWKPSAGGESAFLAFNPDNPEWVMGGSYQGTIELLHQATGEGKGVMETPNQYLAQMAKDMRYRFNWNAPIVYSQHEPNTFFHGGNFLFKSTNNGISWETISPDLTRNDVSKQGKGGAPYTNEGAGGENYGTLAYVAESPHEAGVIWTGSDDGLVHITRDGGKTWSNVTPKGLQECLVNAIEVSPHDKATAYIATTRYKFNDFTPGLYKTTDYGATWTPISGNLPATAYTRVVREDPVRKNLLFAGTETGLFASFDGGKTWQSFQLNLPVTPINDLKIHQGDLIAATSGRSFWIFDDLSLLRQWNPGKATRLYKPADVYRVSGGSPLNENPDPDQSSRWFSPGSGGTNAPTGVVFYLQLDSTKVDATIRMEIRDKENLVVNQFTKGKNELGQGKLPELKKGLNRIVWNLRYPDLPEIPGVYVEGDYDGHRVPPGEYAAVLYVDDEQFTTAFRVLADPRINATETDYQRQHDLLTRVEADIRAMHEAVIRMQKARSQIADWASLAEKRADLKELVTQARELESAMKAWEEEIIQPKSQAYDDVINFENKLSANFLFLKAEMGANIPQVTDGQSARYRELSALWANLKASHDQLWNGKVQAFNKALSEKGLGLVVLP